MNTGVRFVYIDESGDVSVARHNHILVIAALCEEHPKRINRIVRKIQKKYGSSLSSGELKAKKEKTDLKKKLLGALAEADVEVYAVILDRRIIENPPDDPEDLYRWSLARLVKKIATRNPRIEIILDRRYTKKTLRDRLSTFIFTEINDLKQQIIIRHEDSVKQKELQAVDFIAWAFFQKYEHNRTDFYELIYPLIIEEELIIKQIWEQTID